MGTKCPSAASLGDPLVSFPSLGKKLAARMRRNPPPAKNHRSGAPGRGPGQPLLPLRGNSPSRTLRGGRTLPPHPSGLRPATFPLEGGRLSDDRKGRPYGETGPEALVRQSQAQSWNRTSRNFPKTQGPVARREFRALLRFLRAGNAAQPIRRASSVTGSGADSPCQGEMSSVARQRG